MPQWLADELTDLLKLRPVQRRLWAPYQRHLTHYLRFVAVRAARERGQTWERSFTEASKELHDDPAEAVA